MGTLIVSIVALGALLTLIVSDITDNRWEEDLKRGTAKAKDRIEAEEVRNDR